MSPWLKPRILALFCGALLIGGVNYLHAQENYIPPAKTPQEAATNFWKLLDLSRQPQAYMRYGQSEDDMKPLIGSIMRAQLTSLEGQNEASTKLLTLFADEATTPAFEGKVQSSTGNQSIVSVDPGAGPKASEVVVVREDGGYRVDMVATYARWHHLTGANADKSLYEATGWASPALAAQSSFAGVGTTIPCQSNLKQMGLGFMQYCQDYDEKFPLSRNWHEGVMPYIKSEQLFTCPALSMTKKSNGYAYNSKLSQDSQADVTSSAETIMVYETSNLSPTVSAPFTGRAYRHKQNNDLGMNIAFTDGHVKWVKQGTENRWNINPHK